MSKELIDIANKDRSAWTRDDYEFVKTYLKDKPWFSFGHFLITAISNEIGAYSYKSHLRTAALHAGKRQLLFKYLAAKEEVESKLSPSEENSKAFAEITLNRPGSAEEIKSDTIDKKQPESTEVVSGEVRLVTPKVEIEPVEKVNIPAKTTKTETDSEKEKKETVQTKTTEEKVSSNPLDESNLEINTQSEETKTHLTTEPNQEPPEATDFKEETDKVEGVIMQTTDQPSNKNKLESGTQPKEKATPKGENKKLAPEQHSIPKENKSNDILEVTLQETSVYDPEKELLKLIPKSSNDGIKNTPLEVGLQESSTHSFMQWLDLAKPNSKTQKKGKRENKKKDEENKDPLDHFLKNRPTISRPKREFYNPQNMAQKSDVYDGPVTEYLAELYVKQGEIETAIQMYEKLRLQDSSKSAYFANQIKQLKQR